jgi:hypothetical protein
LDVAGIVEGEHRVDKQRSIIPALRCVTNAVPRVFERPPGLGLEPVFVPALLAGVGGVAVAASRLASPVRRSLNLHPKQTPRGPNEAGQLTPSARSLSRSSSRSAAWSRSNCH